MVRAEAKDPIGETWLKHAFSAHSPCPSSCTINHRRSLSLSCLAGHRFQWNWSIYARPATRYEYILHRFASSATRFFYAVALRPTGLTVVDNGIQQRSREEGTFARRPIETFFDRNYFS
jgi:hypothetical protein